MREELGIAVMVVARGPEIVHRYPGDTIRLVGFWCRKMAGEVQRLEVAAWRWVTAEELRGHRFPPASLPLIAAVRQRLVVGEGWRSAQK